MSGLSWTRSHFLGSSTARYAEGSDALEAAKAFADQHGAMLIFQTNLAWPSSGALTSSKILLWGGQ